MCLLTVFPAGQPVTAEHAAWLNHGCDRNPDGFGWAVVAGDEILTGHSLVDDVALADFREIRAEYPQGPALFHSRIATAGLVDHDNTHPFLLGGDDARTVLAHNGVLPTFLQPDKGDLRSDTRIMAEEFLPTEFTWSRTRRNVEALDSPAWRRWFRKNVLQGDKVAFLTTDPRYRKRLYIVGADHGHWAKGVWWSNTSYRPWAPTYKAIGLGWGRETTAWSTPGFVSDWSRDADGTWVRTLRDAGGGACGTCGTLGSVMDDLLCKWCDVCTGCESWEKPCECGAQLPVNMAPRSIMDGVTERQLEDMTDEEWDAFINDRMTRGV
jgi:hypothetical protein